MLAGLILRRIFAHNQENFTAGAQHPIIPVIAVGRGGSERFRAKILRTEARLLNGQGGRKYDLGAMLVTQQPGSMIIRTIEPGRQLVLLSTCYPRATPARWGKFNSHYSDDVLAHLIGEPIPGNCFMWSAPHQPFVLPVRIRSFGSGPTEKNINASAGSPTGYRTSGHNKSSRRFQVRWSASKMG